MSASLKGFASCRMAAWRSPTRTITGWSSSTSRGTCSGCSAPGGEAGRVHYPVDLLQDPQGFLYVAEYGGSDRIQKFAPDGQFVLEFGGLGTEVGKFQRPSGMSGSIPRSTSPTPSTAVCRYFPIRGSHWRFSTGRDRGGCITLTTSHSIRRVKSSWSSTGPAA